MRRRLALVTAIFSAMACMFVTVGGSATAAAPPQVHHLRATSTASGRVDLSWTNPGSASFRSTVVRYAKGTKAPTLKTGHVAARPGRHTHTLRLSHLTSGAQYAFSIYPVLTGNHYGARATVVALVAPGAVTHAQTFAEATGTRLTWTNPTTRSVHRIVARYSRGAVAPTSPTRGHSVTMSGARPDSALLTHLVHDAEYTVSVFAVDAKNGYSTPAITRFTTAGANDADGTYTGLITDTTGDPLAGVEISGGGVGTPDVAASTGTDGRFALTLPAGEYFIEFGGQHITGGTSDSTGYVGDDEDVMVRAGKVTDAGALALDTGAAVTGTITDAQGHGLSGVYVGVAGTSPYVQTSDDSGMFGMYIAGTDQFSDPTTSDGTYTLRGLPAWTSLRLCTDSAGGVTGGSSDAAGYDNRCAPTTFLATAGTATGLPPLALAPARGAGTGTVSGRVTGDHAAVPDATVTLIGNSDNGAFFYGRTDGDGTYTIADIPAGTYDLCVSSDYVSAKVPTGFTQHCQSAPISVSAGGVTTGDVTLAIGGALTGTVTGPGGHRLAGVTVTAETSTDDPYGGGEGDGSQTLTNARGQYTLTGLAAGQYKICFSPSSAPSPGSATGAAPGCFSHPTKVTVSAGRDRSGIDVTLGVGAAITGRVVDGQGHGVAGAMLDASNLADDESDFWGDDATATTDADGRYVLAGLAAGRYDVCLDVFTASGNDNEQCASAPITARTGHTTAAADITVPSDSGIQVTVTDSHGAPVAGVDAAALSPCSGDCVTEPAFSSTADVSVDASFTTDAQGHVALDGIAPGDYAVCLFGYDATTAGGGSATGYADSCTDTSFSIHVTRGTLTPVSLVLADGGAVTGTVTDTSSQPIYQARAVVDGSPAGDLAVAEADDDGGDDFGDGPDPSSPASSGFSFSDGTYTVLGVRPGDRTVCFDATEATGASAAGYRNQCIGAAPDSTSGGQTVHVTAGGVVTGANISLSPAGGISGTVHVSGSASAGKSGVEIIVYAGRHVHERVAYLQPQTAGAYEVDHLAPGDYTVCFAAEDASGQCWHNVPWSASSIGPPLDSATLVTVVSGSVTPGIDATLPAS